MNTMQQTSVAGDRSFFGRLYSRLFSFESLKVLALELLGLLINALATLYVCGILIFVWSPLAVICTGGQSAAHFMEPAIAFSIVMFFYSFSVGLNRESNRNYRLVLQWSVWSAVCVVVLKSIVHATWPVVFALLMALGGAMGSYIGKRWNIKIPEEGLVGVKYDHKKSALVWFFKTFAKSALVGFVLLSSLVAAYMGGDHLTRHAQQVRYVGKPVPAAASFITQESESWTISQHHGKVVLMEFWDTRFDAGRAAFPFLESIHDRFKTNDNFVMVTVCEGDDPAAIQWFNDQKFEWQLLYPERCSMFQPGIRVADSIGAGGFVIAPDGIVTALLVLDGGVSVPEIRSSRGAELVIPFEKERCEKMEAEIERLLGEDSEKK